MIKRTHYGNWISKIVTCIRRSVELNTRTRGREKKGRRIYINQRPPCLYYCARRQGRGPRETADAEKFVRLRKNHLSAQIEMNACAELGWKDADQVLNALWPQVRRKAQDLDGGLPKGQRGIWQAMLDGQRAWLTYRDKHCEAEGGPWRGGSAEPLLIYGCMQRLTEDRVRVLRGFLE